MDKRLLMAVVCPACRDDLVFHGEEMRERLLSGELCCTGCELDFPVIDEVPILVRAGTNMDGAYWEGQEDKLDQWVPRSFENAQRGRDEPDLVRAFIGAARAVDGIALDIASGPGGSYCVQMMRNRRDSGLLVMSDLGAPVMLAWRRHLRKVGWGSRCSNLAFDARRIPFRDSAAAAVTSVGGFGNIMNNRPAYAEAARVLSPGGKLLDLVRLYEEGGPTQRRLVEMEQAAGTWSDYEQFLVDTGFRVQSWGTLNAGRGKTAPADGLPLADEAWEHRVVFAVRASLGGRKDSGGPSHCCG